jgi:molybdopterin synthase catalytic subunit
VLRIVREPIEPRRLESVVREDDGGIVTFYGRVRGDAAGGRRVRSLWYESYESMAVREFERIAAEARERFGDVRLSIVHRVGEVAVGEISVAILAAAMHRAAAFEACRYAIDELKRRAAIWKQERYTDGTAQWRPGA